MISDKMNNKKKNPTLQYKVKYNQLKYILSSMCKATLPKQQSGQKTSKLKHGISIFYE